MQRRLAYTNYTKSDHINRHWPSGRERRVRQNDCSYAGEHNNASILCLKEELTDHAVE